MSSQITIETTQNVNLQYQVAPLGERIVAYIIDALIRIAMVIVLFLVLSVVTVDFFDDGLGVVGTVLLIVFLIPFVFYHLLFEFFNHGQSPGKKIFDLRVVSMKGDQVSFGSYFLRWLFRIVDFHIFSGLVAVIAVAAGGKGQRVGDLVAGTTVIKESRQVQFRQLAFEAVKPDYTPTYPQAAALKPAHIELIKETLANHSIEHADEHVRLLAEKTAAIMQVTYTENPRKFLRSVVNDYSGAEMS